MGSPTEIITQLNSAREIVLKDATIYPQVVPGVLPVIGSGAHVELRRWGADFLAEVFASPVVTADAKQAMSVKVLDTLKGYLSRKEDLGEEEDASVVRSAIQCAASLYPYVFRHTITAATDHETWAKVAGIKSSILRRMDTAPAGARICCIKFVARVVQVQTPGIIADPRRQEQNEISLALVSRDHAILIPSNLEAEASGLLDRLLAELQDNSADALTVTATLNALAPLVQRRPSVAPKILSVVMIFNPLVLASGRMSGKDKVSVRSMTRTTISFLINTLKRNPNNLVNGRIQQTIERLRHGLDEAFSDRAKRPAPDEPTDGLDDAKRRRVDAAVTNGTLEPPPLPPGPVSLAQLFTLSHDVTATNFHVEAIPLDIVNRLIPPLLQHIDAAKLHVAINAVRKRYLDLSKQPPSSALALAKASAGDDEDDDYDPSAEFAETERVLDVLDQAPPEEVALDISIGPFHLPAPPPLSVKEKDEYSRTALTRIFSTLADFDREGRTKSGANSDSDKGFGRLTTSTHDRDGWITLLIRLATRAAIEEDGEEITKPESTDLIAKSSTAGFNLANGIRQTLMNYVMEDFRRRIDVAITWLNEEWYSDRLWMRENETNGSDLALEGADLPHYWPCMLRVLDAMTPYLDVKDSKTLIRFLSEVPQLNQNVMDRLQVLANDPEKVTIITQALLYLCMFRPPVREMVLDTAERLWRENNDAKSSAAKILSRWRPHVLQSEPLDVKAEA